MFKRILPYSLLTLMTVAPGLFTSCEKDDSEPQHKNVEYSFNNMAAPDTISMAADAKSKLVDTVFFKFDGKSLNGKPSSRLIKYWIGPVSRAAGTKFNGGKSVINGCYIDTEADSVSITSMNYQFINSNIGSWTEDLGKSGR